MEDKICTIDEMLDSLDRLMESLNVEEVTRDSNLDPMLVFADESADRSSSPLSEDVKQFTEDFLNKLQCVAFPGDILQYSRISEQIFNKKYSYTYEEVEVLAEKISNLVGSYFKSQLDEDQRLKKRFYKLVDHMKLASFQLGEIAQVSKEKLDKLDLKISESNAALETYNEKLIDSINDTKNEQSKIYIQFVTILGIFTAIVFSMFGGLKLLEFTLSSIQGIATWKATVFFSMFAIATLSMLFLLMRWVSIIVDSVSQKKSPIRFFKGLSSHFGFITSLFFFLYMIFISVIFSNKTVYKNFQAWVSGIENYLILGFVLLLPLLMFALFIVVYLYNTPKNVPSN